MKRKFGNVGGIVGISGKNSNVINCYNTGAINVTSNNIVKAGGIVGCNQGGLVSKCYNTGSITIDGCDHSSHVGGIVGECKEGTTLELSYNTGTISLKSSKKYQSCGGLTGSGYNIKNSYNIGNVTITDECVDEVESHDVRLGGITGVAQGYTENVYSACNINVIRFRHKKLYTSWLCNWCCSRKINDKELLFLVGRK